MLKDVRVDIDGDGRKDRVTLPQVESRRYAVRVIGSKGRTSNVSFRSTTRQDWGLNPWRTVAHADGQPGAEIVIAIAGGDGLAMRVLTWRNGRLVYLPAPPTPGANADRTLWYVNASDWQTFGYRFSTFKKARTVTWTHYGRSDDGRTWSGRVNSFIWRGGGWKPTANRGDAPLHHAADPDFAHRRRSAAA